MHEPTWVPGPRCVPQPSPPGPPVLLGKGCPCLAKQREPARPKTLPGPLPHLRPRDSPDFDQPSLPKAIARTLSQHHQCPMLFITSQ